MGFGEALQNIGVAFGAGQGAQQQVQKNALQDLVQQYQGQDLANPQVQQSFLAQYAAKTGDAAPLLQATGIDGQYKQAQIKELNAKTNQENAANIGIGAQEQSPSNGYSPLMGTALSKLALQNPPQQSQITWNSPAKTDGQSGTAGANSAGTPLSVQNNNPGNMRGSDGQFLQFQSPEDGIDAMQHDLTNKINGTSPVMTSKFGKGYQPTLKDLISTWAPSSENDTAKYIQDVSAQTGIKPDQKLTPDDVLPLTQAMINKEGGQAATSYFGQGGSSQPQGIVEQMMSGQVDSNTGVAPVSAPQGKSAAVENPAAQPQAVNSIQQQFMDSTKKSDPGDLQAIARNAYVSRPDLNWDVLNQIAPQYRSQVVGVASGAIDPARNLGKQAPYIIAAASALDPDYNSGTAKERIKTMQSLAPGGQANNQIKSLQAMTQHLIHYAGAQQDLNNSNSDIPGANYYNKVGNSIPTQNNLAKNKSLDNYSLGLATELSAFLQKGAPHQTEIDEWQKRLDDNSMGQKTNNANLNSISNLVGGQVDALDDSIKSGLGLSGGIKSILSPKETEALDALRTNDTDKLAKLNTGKPSGKVIDYSEYFK